MANVTRFKQTRPLIFEEDDILTLDELCKWLKVKPAWIYRQTREKSIPYIKLGKYLRFERSKIKKWLSDNSQN